MRKFDNRFQQSIYDHYITEAYHIGIFAGRFGYTYGADYRRGYNDEPCDGDAHSMKYAAWCAGKDNKVKGLTHGKRDNHTVR